jgi:hypothetical protein
MCNDASNKVPPSLREKKDRRDDAPLLLIENRDGIVVLALTPEAIESEKALSTYYDVHKIPW